MLSAYMGTSRGRHCLSCVMRRGKIFCLYALSAAATLARAFMPQTRVIKVPLSWQGDLFYFAIDFVWFFVCDG
jgi:hypothetical protein